MKAMIKNIVYGIFIAASGLLVGACSDDESNDPYDINYGFLYAPGVTEHQIKYLDDGSFYQSVDEIEKLVQVRCTRPAPGELKYTVSIDKSLVNAYNEKNGTDYVFLENARLVNSTLTIKKGEYISSDTLKVTYSDQSEFTNGSKNYIVPVTISSIDGGVTLSENKTFYLTYRSELVVCEDAATSTGTQITDCSGWTVLLDGSAVTKLTDGVTSNYQYLGESATLDIDLGKVENVNTVGLYFYSYYYQCQELSISFSKDGTTYDEPIMLNITALRSTHNIHLFKDKQARHVRMTMKNSYYGSGIYIREIYVYAAE